jgi:hypothetical protein
MINVWGQYFIINYQYEYLQYWIGRHSVKEHATRVHEKQRVLRGERGEGEKGRRG